MWLILEASKSVLTGRTVVGWLGSVPDAKRREIRQGWQNSTVHSIIKHRSCNRAYYFRIWMKLDLFMLQEFILWKRREHFDLGRSEHAVRHRSGSMWELYSSTFKPPELLTFLDMYVKSTQNTDPGLTQSKSEYKHAFGLFLKGYVLFFQADRSSVIYRHLNTLNY